MKRVEIYDNVKIVTKDAEVTADRGVYLPKDNLVNLYDRVVIKQDGNFIRGDYAVTDLSTGVSRLLTRKGSGKRVSGVFREKTKTKRKKAERRRPNKNKPLRTHSLKPGRQPALNRKKRGNSAPPINLTGNVHAEKNDCNMNSTLEVFNIGKKYKNRPVLRNVSLNVRRGEAVGLLGPNGAGKTTCFYCVTGLITPDYGDVHIDGQDITNLPMYRRARMGIGYLPQEASIFRSLSVEDNIKAILEIVIDDESRRENMLEELLSEFSIAHLRKSPAIALSGGERRRLEIARALASQPNFILLDEPLAGIDPIAVSEIRNLVSQLKHRGLGVLITDHNVRETLDITDRAYILHGGTVLMEGTPDEIVANKEVRKVYLGDNFSM